MNMPERPLQPPQPAFDASIAFDEFQDEIMHDVMGNERLARPVQALLVTLHELRRIRESFGAEAVNKASAFDALLPNLERLRDACEAQWRDM